MNNNFWLKLKKKGCILALAPMAGITDSAFRVLCREMGADVVYSEMVSADALYYDSKKTIEMLKINKKEHPVVVQLFGKRPELFGKAARIAMDAGADGIDINFGCPAKKVVNHGGGVTLMRDLPLCKKIVQSVLDAVNIPVSVKIRSGINTNQCEFESESARKRKITAVDFVKCIIDLPIAAIMIHGRTYEQGFSGEPDYRMIKRVVELAKTSFFSHPQRRGNIVVLGNGGIKEPDDAKKMLDKTSVDGIGIGQGVFGRPWIFREIKEYVKKNANQFGDSYLNGDCHQPQLSHDEIKKIALRHAKLAYKMKSGHGIVEMRKHLLWYVKGWTDAKELREKLVRVESVEDVKRVLSI
ncbi:MAG: tRNA-dihydrouridine synthase [bacterium]